jgi:hypothetical protein
MTTSADQRIIALLLACLLCSVAMLGNDSSPPEVAISQIPRLEDGLDVRIAGLMVDLYEYESGVESFVLASPDGGNTVKVVSSPAARPQPSEYADFGDRLCVIGEISKTGLVATLFTSSDKVSVIQESEDALTVDILARNWNLFEGDCIRVGGILNFDGLGIGPRLFGYDMNCSLALSMGRIDASAYLERRVLVTGILGFDSRILSLVLSVKGIASDP